MANALCSRHIWRRAVDTTRVPDKQQDMLKKFKSLGFTEMGRLKNGNVFVELKSNDPVRAVVAPDGTVTPLSGDLTRYDWKSRS